MALNHFVDVDIVGSDKEPVPGENGGYLVSHLRIMSELGKLLASTAEIWVKCGESQIDPLNGRIVEEDACTEGATFVAANALLARESLPNRSSGAKRWVTSNQGEEGLRGSVPRFLSAMDGFTIICPDFEHMGVATTPIFAVGGAAANRMTAYAAQNGNISYNHGNAGGPTHNAGVVQANTPAGTYFSFHKASRNIQVYINEEPSGALGAMESDPNNNSLMAGILGSPDNNLDGVGKAAFVILISVALHRPENAELRSKVFALCRKFRTGT